MSKVDLDEEVVVCIACRGFPSSERYGGDRRCIAVPNVGNNVKGQVKALRDKGMEQHRCGKRADAANKLSAAMRKLLMSIK